MTVGEKQAAFAAAAFDFAMQLLAGDAASGEWYFPRLDSPGYGSERWRDELRRNAAELLRQYRDILAPDPDREVTP